jgi:predicted nucleotidyltransferase
MRTDRVVQEALQRVLAVVDAEKVVLFGSVARGTARPDSDLDLLVVADCATHRAVLRELHQALAELAIPVDLHLVAPAALEGNGHHAVFLRSVAADGQVLYNGPGHGKSAADLWPATLSR